MAGIAGNAGSARIAANVILELSEWSVDIERGLEEDTEFADTWESNVATIGKWSGSLKGNWGADATQQGLLQSGHLAGTTIALRLYVNASNYYAGNCYITKMGPSATVKGLVEVSFDFTGTGALAYT